ncbi:MAG: hypothetical protein SF028_13415 [Candidatus Sumerlaeia bacterium]|nr:hypothetical protein [Candidatus Sumerlaeia bacterium]
MAFRRIPSAPLLALAVLAPAALAAQTQPREAQNRQDEVLNINRDASPDSESFKILRSGDKLEINRYVTKVYPLKHANPYEILPYLRTAAALEKGSVATAWIPRPGEPASAWIQVNVPEFQIPYLDAAVAAYDVPDFASIPGNVHFSYRTKYRNAVEVADFIRATTLSPDGLIRGDAATNTIFVIDSPSDFRRDLAQIEFYDVPAPQLDVEVTVVELTEVDQTRLGLDWDAWKSALSGSATLASSSSRTEPSSGGVLQAQARSFDGILSLDATTAARFAGYLVDTGKAEILLRTNLTVTNGTLSTVSSGTDVPAFTYTFNKDLGKSLLTRTPSTPTTEGFSLALVPTVAMNAARLDVAFALRSPVAVDSTGAPIFSEQDLAAELTLEQDQLYKVGGVRRGVTAKQRKGFPLLRDIPVLKYLFSSETDIVRETELYVFLKPAWTSPVTPAMDAMSGDSPQVAKQVSEILKANPNLSISAEDAALLDRYFESKP